MENKHVLCKREELECLRIKAKDLVEELDAILATSSRMVRVEKSQVERRDDLDIVTMLARFFLDATKPDEKKD